MSASSRAPNVLPALPIALMVVGLGMVLIAGLAGTVLWLLTRRRALTVRPAAVDDGVPAGLGEPAEA